MSGKARKLAPRLSINHDKTAYTLEEKIRKCSEILEAFGNAKTVRNDNSSRFGKYTKVLVNMETNQIMGAEMVTYLLEKSRVIVPNKGERNYHIFYHLIYGASDDTLKKIHLKRDPKIYKILSISGQYDVNANFDDVALYKEMVEAFKILNFTEEEIFQTFKIISAVLLIGNVEFTDKEPCELVKDENLFKDICDLLNTNEEDLQRAFMYKAAENAGKITQSRIQQRNNVMSGKNSFAKDLYDRLFKWIVNKLNEGLSNTTDSSKIKYIGLLDIFGFECFEHNGIEQYCINFTNEKLQQIFISDVFKADEIEFKNQGLEEFLSSINFKDNKVIIELMDNKNNPQGIFQLIDNASVGKNDDYKKLDSGLYNSILKAHDKKHPNFTYKRLEREIFRIIHTAKEVPYEVVGFVEKNRDSINSNYMNILKIVDLINWNLKGDGDISDKEKYLGLKFRNDIEKLVSELVSCERHYIRCLKPNEKKIKEFFIPSFVFNQIRYLGILDSIRIRKENFPKRIYYKEFYSKYNDILDAKLANKNKFVIKSLNEIKQLDDEDNYFKDATKIIIEEYFKNRGNNCLLGKTKIYMMQEFHVNLEREFKKLLMGKIKSMKKVVRMIKWFSIDKKTKNLLVTYRNELFKREIYRTKYKQISKENIRSVITRVYLNRTINEYKKNMIFKRINYKIFFTRVFSFINCKKNFQVAAGIMEEIFDKAFSFVERNYNESIFIDNSRKYYNFLLKKKISKTLNAIKRLRNISKLGIFEFRIWHKNEVQRIIARNWLGYYLKKTAIAKRINEYIEEDRTLFEEINEDTDKILFPHTSIGNKGLNDETENDFNNREGAMYAIHQVNIGAGRTNNINEYQSKILNTNTNINSTNIIGGLNVNDISNRKIAFNNDNLRNKQYMQMQRYNVTIPNFDYYGEMKIVLFAKIINMDSVVKDLFFPLIFILLFSYF